MLRFLSSWLYGFDLICDLQEKSVLDVIFPHFFYSWISWQEIILNLLKIGISMYVEKIFNFFWALKAYFTEKGIVDRKYIQLPEFTDFIRKLNDFL